MTDIDTSDDAPPSTQSLLGGGGGAPTAKFPSIGTTVGGRVTRKRVSQQTDIQGNKKFWPDNDPMWQIEATVETGVLDPSIDGDDGQRRIFIKGQMMRAVSDALEAVGVTDIEEGGTLHVTYVSDKPSEKRGYSPAKQYEATYTAPTLVERAWASSDEEPF